MHVELFKPLVPPSVWAWGEGDRRGKKKGGRKEEKEVAEKNGEREEEIVLISEGVKCTENDKVCQISFLILLRKSLTCFEYKWKEHQIENQKRFYCLCFFHTRWVHFICEGSGFPVTQWTDSEVLYQNKFRNSCTWLGFYFISILFPVCI